MKYKFTLLKDLPDNPAGTVFNCSGIVNRYGAGDAKPCDYYVITSNYQTAYHKVGSSVFDNSEWFRKEIDYKELTELKCPKCGNTRAHIHVKNWYVRDIDADDYGAHSKVTIECVCGFTRPL